MSSEAGREANSNAGWGPVLGDADVVVCCGSGGVGKTTIAAVVGLQMARQGRRVMVLTIDPAKRLADALGLTGGLDNEPARIDIDAPGELWAAMLDTSATFDALVAAHAPSRAHADNILANRFYRNIAGSFGGTQDYMAVERLHALHADDRFDVVVIDTPPSRNALDFLDAPGVLGRFLDHPLFKLLMLPTRRGLKVLNIAAQPVLRSIGKVVGGEVLADAIDFFQAFDGLQAGFRQRADDVIALLHSTGTRFVLVASPKADTVEEATYFARQLHAADLDVAAVVVNRCTPTFPTPPGRRRKADAELWNNLDELTATASAERRQLHRLTAALEDRRPSTQSWVPMLAHDVHDLEALDTIRLLLFGDWAV